MTSKSTELSQAVSDVLREFNETTALFSSLEQWDSLTEITQNIDQVRQAVGAIIIVVEVTANEIGDIQGSDKQKAVAAALDDLISFPVWLELVDGFVFEIIIGIVVSGLNARFGKDWSNLLSIREKLSDIDDLLKVLKHV